MLRFISLVVIASLTVLAPVSLPRGQRVIDQDIWVPAAPLAHCVVPELAGHVFKATLTPGGVEYLPGRCVGDQARSVGERKISSQGTARVARRAAGRRRRP